jgi:hypothetical protein
MGHYLPNELGDRDGARIAELWQYYSNRIPGIQNHRPRAMILAYDVTYKDPQYLANAKRVGQLISQIHSGVQVGFAKYRGVSGGSSFSADLESGAWATNAERGQFK